MKPAFYDIERDGITQGLLNCWRSCREMAWLFLQGYSLKRNSMGLVFGTIIHAVLEDIYGMMQQKKILGIPTAKNVKWACLRVEKIWEKENPKASAEGIQLKELSLLLAEAILPLYFEYWHKDKTNLPWVGLEQEFKIPYKLADGRKTFLRGKMDGIYKKNGIWLFETKGKSQINEVNLVDTLGLDFQNNFYLSNVRRLLNIQPSGVKYNVIRRTQMQQSKKENLKQFANRIIEDIEKRPEYYFLRFELSITKQELDKFDEELGIHIKEFYDWWDTKRGLRPNRAIGHYKNPSQCETKYGRCDMLDICSAGNFSRYEKRKVVFRELEDF